MNEFSPFCSFFIIGWVTFFCLGLLFGRFTQLFERLGFLLLKTSCNIIGGFLFRSQPNDQPFISGPSLRADSIMKAKPRPNSISSPRHQWSFLSLKVEFKNIQSIGASNIEELTRACPINVICRVNFFMMNFQ